MESVHLKDLLEAGCHFGHRTERWHPKAAQYIYQPRQGIHIIDLAKTKERLEIAAQMLLDTAATGKTILYVGTKRQAKATIKENAESLHMPYLNERWIGGFLTNWDTVHKNLEKIRNMEKEQAENAWKQFPKHEQLNLSRYLLRLKRVYGGVIELYELPSALFVVDIRKEKAAVKEAKLRGIPVIGIVDTNTDPSLVDFPIPANDDAVGSIEFIVKYISAAIAEGQKVSEDKKAQMQKEQEAAKKQAEKAAVPKIEPKAEVKAEVKVEVSPVKKEEVKKKPEKKVKKS